MRVLRRHWKKRGSVRGMGNLRCWASQADWIWSPFICSCRRRNMVENIWRWGYKQQGLKEDIYISLYWTTIRSFWSFFSQQSGHQLGSFYDDYLASVPLVRRILKVWQWRTRWRHYTRSRCKRMTSAVCWWRHSRTAWTPGLCSSLNTWLAVSAKSLALRLALCQYDHKQRSKWVGVALTIDHPTSSPCAVKLSWLENVYSRPLVAGLGDFDR